MPSTKDTVNHIFKKRNLIFVEIHIKIDSGSVGIYIWSFYRFSGVVAEDKLLLNPVKFNISVTLHILTYT